MARGLKLPFKSPPLPGDGRLLALLEQLEESRVPVTTEYLIASQVSTSIIDVLNFNNWWEWNVSGGVSFANCCPIPSIIRVSDMIK
jgi:hypothetical protein